MFSSGSRTTFSSSGDTNATGTTLQVRTTPCFLASPQARRVFPSSPSSASHADVLPPSISVSPPPASAPPRTRDTLPPGVQSDPEGALWRDPPQYWEQIVWPAYVRAHARMLGGDVEHGRPTDAVPGLVLLDGLERSMGATVELVCARLVSAVQESQESQER